MPLARYSPSLRAYDPWLLPRSEAAAQSADLVSVRIANVRCIEIRVVVQPQPGRAVRLAAVSESGGVEIVDLFPGARAERNHAAVADRRRLLIERLADPERELAQAIVLVHAPPRRDAVPGRIVRDAT